MKKSIVGLKELRENMDQYIRKIAKGDSFVVMRRSQPVFIISAVDDDEEGWETMIDFTKIKKGGILAKDLLARLKSFG